MCPDPRQELVEILDHASAFLKGLKADGVQQIEVSLASLTSVQAPKEKNPPRVILSPLPQVLVPKVAEKKVATAAAGMENEMNRIALEIVGCKKCSLHKTRIQTVPGQGNTKRPEIMFIGEAPGADEDEQGLAFVGRAGQLVTKMIAAMGFQREEVFIANILKCRPPDNRAPTPEEMAICIPYLKRQIAEVQPKVIVALGATAVLGLLNLTGISRLRGTWLSFEGIDLMPTYHPSYLLRNPSMKKEAWSDLQAVLKRLGRTPPPVKR